MPDLLERWHVSIVRYLPRTLYVGELYAGYTKPDEQMLGEADMDVIIATDGAAVLECDRTDSRPFPCERGDILCAPTGDRLRVIGMSLRTEGKHCWQIIAEMLEV